MAAPDRASWVQSLTPLADAWAKRTGIPASIWLAMAASESNWGAAGNSLFGIKGSGSAGSLSSPTWESEGGQRVNTNADFAAYNNPNEAFQSFWNLVSTSPRYAEAMKHLPNDPGGFLQGINQAGYATDPKWASSIESLAATTIPPLMSGGGKTMGQMQEGTPPALTPEQAKALIQSALNGGSTSSDTILVAGGDGNSYLVNKTTGVGTMVQGVPGKPPAEPKADDVQLKTADDGTLHIVNLTKGTSTPVTGFPQAKPQDKGTGQFNTVTDPRTGEPIALQNPVTGAVITLPKADYSQDQTLNLGARGVFVIHKSPTGGYQTEMLIPPEPAATPDPTDTAYKQALTAEANANAAKTQRALRPTAQAAIADSWATIDAIQKQIASGQMTPTEGDALMTQVHQGLSATLAGTTLFERQKQAEDTATQRANQATSLLNQRVQSAASLGSSLFSAATGHVMLPKGQATLGIDPLAIANQEVNTMGGGQSTGDAAAAFLKSVLGGQGALPPPGPGGAAPGQPAAGGFPTTREDVLARYPELAATPDNAAAPQTAGTAFVPPNYEATASDVPLTVLPPRPMSLTNQRIQAGG